MGEQLPSSPERMPMQHRLGLERLDRQQREDLRNFIYGSAPWLMTRFREEAEAVENGEPWQPESIDVERLARSINSEERAYAASAVAEYLERNPDADYRIWERLVDDPDEDVSIQAGRFLLSALGRRDLDPVRLLPVLTAYSHAESWRFEKERPRREREPGQR